MNLFCANHDPTVFARRFPWRGVGFLRAFFLCLLIFLTACEGGSTTPSQPQTTGRDTNIRVEPDLSTNQTTLRIDPLLPPGGEVRPAKTGETGRPRSPEGLPVIEPKGINADQLFATPIKDTDKRIERLENAVVEMRKDLDAALPAIDHLVSIEGDIQELVTQLQTLLNQEGIPTNASRGTLNLPPLDAAEPDGLITDNAGIEPLNAEALAPPPAPKVYSTDRPADLVAPQESSSAKTDGVRIEPPINSVIQNAVKPAATSTPSTAAPLSLAPLTPATPPLAVKNVAPKIETPSKIAPKSTESPSKLMIAQGPIATAHIRLGDHQGKVRIVVDASAPIKMTTDLDTTEHILVVDVTGVDITPGTLAPKNALVKSIALTSTGPKTGRIAFELSKESTIKFSRVMPPSDTNPNTRAIIDLSK